jgi:hypothetical protein
LNAINTHDAAKDGVETTEVRILERKEMCNPINESQWQAIRCIGHHLLNKWIWNYKFVILEDRSHTEELQTYLEVDRARKDMS